MEGNRDSCRRLLCFDVVDFGSVADLLVELNHRAQQHGLTIARIIVAPEYVHSILTANSASGIGRMSDLFTRPAAWVRHDGHLQVDFQVAAPSPNR